jgi:hypothetical protein
VFLTGVPVVQGADADLCPRCLDLLSPDVSNVENA